MSKGTKRFYATGRGKFNFKARPKKVALRDPSKDYSRTKNKVKTNDILLDPDYWV